MNRRSVLVHYHIFKNAGTSFERVLDENFGDRHMTFDGPFSFSQVNQDQLATVIDHHPSQCAFSSHQIHLPVPSSLNFRAIPIVFVRHPLLRIRSVYLFGQRDQQAADPSATSAPLAGFEDWVASMLAGDKNRLHLSNLQTGALSRAYNLPPKRSGENGRVCFDLQAAINNLLLVPCLGRTDHFDTDVMSFADSLARFDIDFSYQPGRAENVSSPDYNAPIEDQLRSLEHSVTAETWEKLHWLNHQDLALFDIVQEMVEQRLSSGIPIHLA
ncbi:MAG: sulfotransferase family 2 domain-containing protein [Luminiphilus sp.]|jgi:hypothetical protein|nr:sulfotransferase family 2 domain-containing protein [Luminiphilus sp.]